MSKFDHFDEMRMRDIVEPKIPGGAVDGVDNSKSIEVGVNLIKSFIESKKGTDKLSDLYDDFLKNTHFGANAFTTPNAREEFLEKVAPIVSKHLEKSPHIG